MSREIREGLKLIAGLVPPGSKVLDIGCGEGELLDYLVHQQGVDGRGIELSLDGVKHAVGNGLSVIQGDADSDLHYYPDDAFDYAILSLTLQATRQPHEVMKEMLRIARRAVVAFPNFAYWRNRFYLMLNGRMPVTRDLPYEWYDTPNIHFCTIRDFIVLSEEVGFTIEKQFYISPSGHAHEFSGFNPVANFLGKEGVFVVRRK